MEATDSSNSGIVGGVSFPRCVGLDGAEATEIGWWMDEFRDRRDPYL